MKRLLTTTAILAAMAGPAFAENHASTPMEGQMTEFSDNAYQATNLMGMAVWIPQEGTEQNWELSAELSEAPDDWEQIADLGDFIMTPEGQLEAVILDVGGFLGMGEKQVAVSFDDLKIVPDADDAGDYFVVYTGDRSIITEGEAFDAAWLHDAEMEAEEMEQEAETAAAEMGETLENAGDEVATAAAGAAAAVGAAAEEAEAEVEQEVAEADAALEGAEDEAEQEVAEMDGDPMTGQQPMTEDALATLTAEELEGVELYGANGEEIGEISDVVIADNGVIESIIIDVGGFLGLGEKPVALQFDDIELTSGDGAFSDIRATTDFTEEELESMERWNG